MAAVAYGELSPVDLDLPLLQLTPRDFFRLRDAVLGLLVTGGIGAGKTTAMKAVALAYLMFGMGGIVMCAKPGEAQRWLQYCQQAGRAESVIVMNGRNVCFNFLDYEISRHGINGIDSAIECLMQLVEAARMASASPGREGEKFWTDMIRQVLRVILPLLYMAYGRVTIPDIIRCLRSAPTSREEAHSAQWQADSFLYQTLLVAAQRVGDHDPTLNRIADYMLNEWATMPDKTRGNVAVSLTTVLDRFTSGWLKDTFASDTNCPPEMTFHGAVVILDMPPSTMNEDGLLAQIIYKFMWQRAVLARGGLDPIQRVRPVFWWADEGHLFLHPNDANFLSLCREALACVVLISQSLPSFYGRMPGENSKDIVHQLLGNFGSRLWLNNACHETNGWASATLGKVIHRRANFSEGRSEGHNMSYGMNMGENASRSVNWDQTHYHSSPLNPITKHSGNEGSGESWGRNKGYGSNYGTNSSHGYSEQMDDLLPPAFFSRSLMTGGPSNGNRVSGVWFQAGRTFEASRGNSLLAVFQQ